MSKPVFPNLIIAGFPKCGTHALLHNLGHHPDIHAHPHELGFFEKPDASRSAYQSHFRSDCLWNVEKSPLYAVNRDAMRRMASLVPAARVILCIRHPIQAVHSFYHFRVFEFLNGFRSGVDPARYSFETWVLEEPPVRHFSIQYFRYMDHMLEHVLPCFPPDQIHVVIQERMMADMAAGMGRVFQWLGLSSLPDAFEVKLKFHGEQYRYPHIDYHTPGYRAAVDKLWDLYERPNQALRSRLGDPLPEWDVFDRMYARGAT